MKGHFRHARKRSRGSVAVECALILPVILALMTSVLLLGRIFWTYTAAEKAAHDAARFLASVPVKDMRGTNGEVVPVISVAKQIARDEMRDTALGAVASTTILCYGGTPDPYWEECIGIDTPLKVRVRVTVTITDPLFTQLTWWFNGGEPIVLRAVMATDYVGS